MKNNNFLKTINLEEQSIDLFQLETYRKRWFPTFTLEQGRVRNKDLKMVCCFSESETSESFNWRSWSGGNS